MALHITAEDSALAASAVPGDPWTYFVQFQAPDIAFKNAMVSQNDPTITGVINPSPFLGPKLASTIDADGVRNVFYLSPLQPQPPPPQPQARVFNLRKTPLGIWEPGPFDGRVIPANPQSQICATIVPLPAPPHAVHLFVRGQAGFLHFWAVGDAVFDEVVPPGGALLGTALTAVHVPDLAAMHLFYQTEDAGVRRIIFAGGAWGPPELVPGTFYAVAGTGLAAISWADQWRLYFNDAPHGTIREVGGPQAMDVSLFDGDVAVAAVNLHAVGEIRHVLFKGPAGGIFGNPVVVRRAVGALVDGVFVWHPQQDLPGP
ncbi:hypothetical protein FN846DRAFT_88129 [Sphaerosporella brunnea]|uniref:Fucose-specific lectin n=1 Tax=Sphaerosporella brunnea TaxID=1250544 RepID=A0A5J5EU39_9PEZI|nr:hypothetical protein FN846DRAFT_88129 [Sphaerosporella brunnea]